MYGLLFTLIAGILGLTTIGICALQPQMHKTFFVYNSDYVIVEPADKVEVVKNLPTQVNQPQKEEKKSNRSKSCEESTENHAKTGREKDCKKLTAAGSKNTDFTADSQSAFEYAERNFND